MKKTFQGHVVTAGTCQAEALVSRGGFNTLASYQTPMLTGDKKVRCSDQNNPDLYQKSMVGKALCLPETIGSTTGGMALYTVCATGSFQAYRFAGRRRGDPCRLLDRRQHAGDRPPRR